MNIKRVTIDDLPTATAQEVFDHIANHLLTQNQQAMLGTVCVYRTDYGLACAAGSLFDPSNPRHMRLTREYNSCTWAELLVATGLPAAHGTLIRNLQRVHDNRVPEHWRASLKHIANSLSLEWKFG